MTRTRTIALAAGSLLALSSLSCDRSETSAARHESALILFVGRWKDGAAWPIVEAVAAEFRETRPWIRLECIAPDRPDPEAQRSLLARLQVKSCDALCVWPSDPTSLRTEIVRLTRAGLPVITVGSDVSDSGRIGYCGPDEREIGRAAAQACAAALGDWRKTLGVLYARAAEGEHPARWESFRRTIAATPSIQLVREVAVADGESEAEQTLLMEVRKYPRMEGWCLLDDWSSIWTRPNSYLVPPQTALVVCPMHLEALDLLGPGLDRAVVSCNLRLMIQRSLGMAEEVVRDHRLRVAILYIPPEIVTRASRSAFEAAQLGRTTTR